MQRDDAATADSEDGGPPPVVEREACSTVAASCSGDRRGTLGTSYDAAHAAPLVDVRPHPPAGPP
eukprot:9967007-Alexandrium_andersonii.AAC.1